MKNLKFAAIILLIAMLGGACKKDSTTPSVTTAASNPIVGNWKVSSFIKDSVDLTNQFNGYTFTCNSNGGMTIQGNSNNYNNCSWNNNSNNNSMCHFHIMDCGNNSVLWECDDDWDLTNHDTQHCYFSNHNPNHHNTMTWIKI